MDLLNAFMSQGMIAQIGEIVLFVNTITMSMPSRWRGNVVLDGISKVLNFLSMNIFKNRNMDDR